jgi:hypothetical protein
METIKLNRFLQLFNKLSPPEQLAVADRISEQTLADRWKIFDSELPDTQISDDDIMDEVRAVRYGNKKA